ncbi:hypothetical protein [Paenibacillus gorillae]|uniref:hypothetical protein n=1 Tax=Paenibacillus gorillae TaxID=1243662 RepID=UPI0012DC38F5|nr:hypothetical protein [Paenibacillus gorillae]
MRTRLRGLTVTTYALKLPWPALASVIPLPGEFQVSFDCVAPARSSLYPDKPY